MKNTYASSTPLFNSVQHTLSTEFIQDTGLAAGVDVEIQKSPRHNPCP